MRPSCRYPNGIGLPLAVVLMLVSTAVAERRPNIVLILADDLGYADLGCQGSQQVRTPHIDSLARDGIRFTAGYVTAPQCSPSRAGLITGQYQQRFGHEQNPARPFLTTTFGLDAGRRTLAGLLKEAGYATVGVGKWDLGARAESQPWRQGFDHFFGFYTGSRSYFRLPGGSPDSYNHLRDGPAALVPEKGYMTDVLTDAAVRAIERHREEPFFLYLAYNAPHWPMQAPDEKLKAYAHMRDLHRRTFLAMMESLDDGVGRVLAALRAAGLEENTLVVFLSDNGGPTGSPRSSPDAEFEYGRNTSLNTPLRGVKGDVYEGGIRVPFLMRWRGRLPAGEIRPEPVSALDLLPTALAAAGVELPADLHADGVNLLPYLTSRRKLESRDLYWRFRGDAAIRSGDWKLVIRRNHRPELYDLSKDIAEAHDLSADRAEQVRRLREKLDRWQSELQPARWQETTTAPAPRTRRAGG